ncbi:MAG: TIM barrel protein [Phycisphaera sp.]|nr:TIM barrel protein [Phycisphaera sp.]
MSRRDFVRGAAATAASISAMSFITPWARAVDEGNPLFRISLAEWSINKRIRGAEKPEMTNLDFPAFARECEIDAVEYVNQLWMDKARDMAYLKDLKKRCDDHGIYSNLIMCDHEGNLGDPDDKKRMEAVENHKKWADAAKFLGCKTIRVNAHSEGTWDEQKKLAADGLVKLAEYCTPLGLNVVVENHGGLSSHGRWLSEVMMLANNPHIGTLPDFGNFRVDSVGKGKSKTDVWYDRYLGVHELMPFAKAVSAKTHEFDDKGNEIHTDYMKMMRIVLSHGYRDWVGIEYEAGDEKAGIIKTRDLLRRVRDELMDEFKA